MPSLSNCLTVRFACKKNASNVCVNKTSALLLPCAALSVQSQVEETLERIKVQPGVEGYVICNMDGQVLRRFPTMAQETAEMYAASMKHLTNKV
jgi:Roadblock/LC7 domain